MPLFEWPFQTRICPFLTYYSSAFHSASYRPMKISSSLLLFQLQCNMWFRNSKQGGARYAKIGVYVAVSEEVVVQVQVQFQRSNNSIESLVFMAVSDHLHSQFHLVFGFSFTLFQCQPSTPVPLTSCSALKRPQPCLGWSYESRSG